MTTWSDGRPVDTCTGCLAWGHIFARQLCAACYAHDSKWPQGTCGGCQRTSALRHGYCRLCWDNARTLAHETGIRHITAIHRIAEVRHPKLFVANINSRRRNGGSSRSRARRRSATASPPPAGRRSTPPPPAPPADGQLCLFRLGEHGVVAYDEHQHQATAGHQALRAALRILGRGSEIHGWGTAMSINARRALTLMLAGYADGDRLTHSDLLTVLHRPDRCLSVARTAQILQEMGVYVNDRRSRLDRNLAAKLDGLAPGIAAETEQWIRGLVDGGPRRAPRSKQTALRYLHAVQPALRPSLSATTTCARSPTRTSSPTSNRSRATPDNRSW